MNFFHDFHHVVKDFAFHVVVTGCGISFEQEKARQNLSLDLSVRVNKVKVLRSLVDLIHETADGDEELANCDILRAPVERLVFQNELHFHVLSKGCLVTQVHFFRLLEVIVLREPSSYRV